MSSLFGPSLASYIPPALSGGAKAARRALKDVRQDARQAAASSSAPVATTVAPLGAYDPQAWSLLGSLKSLLASFQHLLGQLVAPAGPKPDKPDKPGKPPEASPPGAPATGKTNFKIASFNILSSGHTDPGGDVKGYALGVERTRMAVALLKQQRVDVVGFQEMANDQAREFRRVASDTYGLYPGASKTAMMSQNSIAWRKEDWDFVKGETIRVRSHKGNMWPVPIVRLRNKETGKEAYFCNFHNAPGFSKGLQQHNRDEATTAEVALINRLKRSGLPVIVTGDMNEKANYHRRLSHEADMHSANELKNGALPKQLGIDWIFGSDGVRFTNYASMRPKQKITDHPLITSDVQLER